MSYATVDDYINFYGEAEAIEQTNLDDSEATTVHDDRLARMLASASAEIDGHLAARYALPIPAPHPAMLTEIAATIARKNLDRYQRREHVQKDYEQAIDRLKRLAKGQEILLDATGNPIAPAPDDQRETGEVSFGPGRQTFTYQTLGRYSRSWD